MQDLNDLYYFAQVVQAGGFSAAARRLDIPKSRLSRRIALLEERLQMRLLQRTTRRLRLTAAGERYLQYCQSIIESARAAEDAMQQMRAEPAGTVTLSAPVAVAQESLQHLLPEFLAQWPKVDVQVIATNRRIDLVAEGVDLALRVRTRLDTDADMVVRRLGVSSALLVASPAFLQRHGTPTHPAELADYPALAFSETAGPQRWTLHGPRGEEVSVSVRPRLCANDFPVLAAAAVAHQGIGLLPDMGVLHAIAQGKLVRVLPQWGSGSGIFHMVYPSRRGMLPAVKALAEFLTARLPAGCVQHPAARAGHEAEGQ
ncbi:LysR substrate-binding domain-containing protein [Orrella sp. JC864]|uniref:LysR substrate-binding domain-containing protein n=1 Tax=Orrella sp. JC864 TaxID=3120298 RepID=UPI00300AEF21